MSKICKSCGEYYDGDYCTKCGYGKKDIKSKAAEKYKKYTKPVRFMTDEEKKKYYDRQHENYTEKQAGAKKAKSNKNLLIFIIIIAFGIITAGLISSGVISWGDKNDVIEDYFEAITERDFDQYIKCFPSEIRKSIEDERDELGYSKKEYMDEFVSVFKDEYGDGFSVSVECGRATELKEYSMEQYKEAYGSAPNISEAYEVAATVTLRGSKKSDDEHFDCLVGKVRGRWKIFNLEYTAGTITPES